MPHLLTFLVGHFQLLFQIIDAAFGHMQHVLLLFLDELVDGRTLRTQLVLQRFVAGFQVIDGEVALFEDAFHHPALEFCVSVDCPSKGRRGWLIIFESLHFANIINSNILCLRWNAQSWDEEVYNACSD